MDSSMRKSFKKIQDARKMNTAAWNSLEGLQAL